MIRHRTLGPHFSLLALLTGGFIFARAGESGSDIEAFERHPKGAGDWELRP